MTTAVTTEKKLKRQTFTGVVTSNKMKDTVVVAIERYVRHAKYHKYMNKKTKLMVHDAGNIKNIGDTATIEACRPLSKNKSFRVIA
ncbi:MAG: 30S ribosomal protein S17 [Candidatus Taylorbacteria bacterium RIFCSPHIGHO2_02_FULL_45_28]|uniref:Small ribosomal subunit protein uS17 n=1 Tax=Candidatus Taylorbacteria bacterium RIFCSPHIGHO2_12_FULL_45_16 TaxID=1802315 RepID=A0A1G2MZ50_9BACT|nr:MAG: 30S ribosomal protein S17 [Candidatus Taylorbacteria bacterium RIFCSPHIGHO2_01_FULL_44_110]OHA25446.1 MAG: 30S ribosomal protein S17 [Candidatus Taylorbacteria bacterium RIFCSPHIGHO2_02_FULL_45_28]OHA29114.1 MAG: 30S ribosomal protein S17 [Candidatus Taylorbacteria bacterium RIFCSPHIGHO2_12_FULL_45_16]OHA33336.1 MAG: 30S ribosomal protein S17 [Candidatus Taylorbacteria bacterium RIFCSPLOWO2_01_FULL_45_59]OHA38751.1 MAG: 30S ribosomal protein S17 [Candidatus Taylorbacteria bacterium RIFC